MALPFIKDILMEFVTLINRTSKSLKGTWDGRQHDLAPGKHSFPRVSAEKFKAQNPLMGSEDPYTFNKQYLIGIEEDRDDCSPIEQSDSPTLQDVADKLKSGEYKLIRSTGLYGVRDPLPLDSTFVNPK